MFPILIVNAINLKEIRGFSKRATRRVSMDGIEPRFSESDDVWLDSYVLSDTIELY
jgi:hypothetical protein